MDGGTAAGSACIPISMHWQDRCMHGHLPAPPGSLDPTAYRPPRTFYAFASWTAITPNSRSGSHGNSYAIVFEMNSSLFTQSLPSPLCRPARFRRWPCNRDRCVSLGRRRGQGGFRLRVRRASVGYDITNRQPEAWLCGIYNREDPGQGRVTLDMHYTQHDTTPTTPLCKSTVERRNSRLSTIIPPAD